MTYCIYICGMIEINDESQLNTPRGMGQDSARVPDEELTKQVQSIPGFAGRDCIGEPDDIVGSLLNSELPVDYRGCSYKTKPNEMNTHISDKSYIKGVMDIPSPFERDLCALINAHSAEEGTPDFILSKYLTESLRIFKQTINDRDNWYGISSPNH